MYALRNNIIHSHEVRLAHIVLKVIRFEYNSNIIYNRSPQNFFLYNLK